ncbi:MAG: signal peptidase II [Intestinibacillus sp.]
MIAVIAILLMVAADQLVKYWAVTVLQAVPGGTIPLIQNVFHLTYVENRGAAFSILQNKIWLFVLITVVILGAMVYVLRRGLLHTALGRWAVYVIAGGAVGNLLDRIFRHYVVDLFDFRLIHFPVFNVADICVCVGGVLFAYYFLFQHDKAVKE